jgi:peroxiredoxin
MKVAMVPSTTFRRLPLRSPTSLDATILRHRLIGTKVAAKFTVGATNGKQVRLGGPAAALVAYLFPGSASSPEYGADTPLVDAEQHCSFRDLHEEMTALGLIVVGISNQPAAKLREMIAASGLPQLLVSDPTLRLGEMLRLPTFRLGAEQLYERLTLLVVAGKITRAFYPVPNPSRHAAEVLDHLNGR